jgi:predicted enzyme related to lactoylglutathione lyase
LPNASAPGMRPESAGGAWIKLKLRQGQEIRYRPIDRTAQLSKLPISGQVGNTKVQMKSSPLGFQSVKVIALAATDVVRAKRFYSETLQLEEDREATDEVGYRVGNSILIIRQHPPTDDPNPRITLEVQDARETEKRLTERAVTISDPVKLYEDKFWVGGFLDSEGNKLWFCSYA